MKNSSTEENYLKVIFHLSNDEEPVATNAIASSLQTTAASVTDMIKRLADKKLVEYQPYKGVKMTSEGKKIALLVVRKHRLWEVFLVNKLNIPWDRIHETAEQLEHVDSAELIDRLDEYLGFPRFDPHGDPIPGKDGSFEERKTYRLDEIPDTEPAKIAGVLSDRPEFLRYLDKLGMNIGVTLRIKDRIPFEQSLTIAIGGREVIVSGDTARKVLVTLNPGT